MADPITAAGSIVSSTILSSFASSSVQKAAGELDGGDDNEKPIEAISSGDEGATGVEALNVVGGVESLLAAQETSNDGADSNSALDNLLSTTEVQTPQEGLVVEAAQPSGEAQSAVEAISSDDGSQGAGEAGSNESGSAVDSLAQLSASGADARSGSLVDISI